jgi:hypothetical protein
MHQPPTALTVDRLAGDDDHNVNRHQAATPITGGRMRGPAGQWLQLATSHAVRGDEP